MEFTKGKWINGYGDGLTGPTTPTTCNPTVDKNRKYIPVSIDRETIEIVIQPENNSITQMKANALLISKAPEMLEMLKRLIQPDLDISDLIEAEQLIKEATEL